MDGFCDSQASCPTTSQPKSLAISDDSTVFVVEVDVVEAIKSNQRVYNLKPNFTPSSVAANGTTVAIGGEVRALPSHQILLCTLI